MLYPVFLELKGRECLVVGAGKVALRKVERLLETGAMVDVVAPEFDEGFSALEQTEHFRRISSEYSTELLDGKMLAIAATSDPVVNRQVFMDAEARAILINVVDAPELCNFQVPAIMWRGDLQIAVSSSGKAPILAKRIREELEELYPEGMSELLSIIASARVNLRTAGADTAERGAALARAIDRELIELARSGKFDEIRERIKNCIS